MRMSGGFYALPPKANQYGDKANNRTSQDTVSITDAMHWVTTTEQCPRNKAINANKKFQERIKV